MVLPDIAAAAAQHCVRSRKAGGIHGRAVGIGGVFFRAADVPDLVEWYKKHLGIDNLHKSVWQQDAGMTIFGPFARDSDYFDSAEQQWMISMPSSRSSRTKV
ncbi:hypothetical protein AGR7B_Lc160014 [Agrobacterium deltaense RV3]|nr:hypothetical protein AGR7B_Lc160014 [Agrobacterium deltaense RV3]